MNEILLSGAIGLVLILFGIIKAYRAASLRTEQEKLSLAFSRAQEARKRGRS